MLLFKQIRRLHRRRQPHRQAVQPHSRAARRLRTPRLNGVGQGLEAGQDRRG
jgi:hypothetical protein